jgi:lysophospholipase L1-like esterase
MNRGRKWLTLSALGSIGGATVILRRIGRPPTTNSYYVALGSSFSAGLGLGAREAASPSKFLRTINGYPQQLARLLKVPSFTDMTSSGATVRQVLNGGQLRFLGPQIDALGPDTRLVSITAGGNDIGYVGDLTAMAFRNGGGLMGSLVGLFWKGPKPVSERDFERLEADFSATLREIKRRSPQARIVVISYPAILPRTGTCLALGITEDQAASMRPIAERLAQVTRDIAVRMGATLVDMAVLSEGHDACSAEPWVNGFKPERGASFHPTLTGARATAHAIASVIG